MISTGEGDVYAAVHRSALDAVPNAHVFGAVICPPIADEFTSTRRVLFNLAEALASQGIPSVRLDYLGNGESDGRSQTRSIASCVDNICHVVNALRHSAELGPVVFIGMRLGALFGRLAVARVTGVTGLVSIDPIESFGRYAEEIEFGSRITSQADSTPSHLARSTNNASVETNGYVFSNTFLAELRVRAALSPLPDTVRKFTIRTGRRSSKDADGEHDAVKTEQLLVVDTWRYWAKKDIYRLPSVEKAVLYWMTELRREMSR
jgi:pimeloyl-ACP methyl ester carboxylesterase